MFKALLIQKLGNSSFLEHDEIYIDKIYEKLKDWNFVLHQEIILTLV